MSNNEPSLKRHDNGISKEKPPSLFDYFSSFFTSSKKSLPFVGPPVLEEEEEPPEGLPEESYSPPVTKSQLEESKGLPEDPPENPLENSEDLPEESKGLSEDPLEKSEGLTEESKGYNDSSNSIIVEINDKKKKFEEDNFRLLNNEGVFLLAIDHTDSLLPHSQIIPHDKLLKSMIFLMEKKEDETKIKILRGTIDYDKLFMELSSDNKQRLKEYQEQIIKNFLTSANKMSLPIQYPCICSYDMPTNIEDITDYYHKDNLVTELCTTELNLDDVFTGIDPRIVNISFFNYNSICVSTTFKFLYKEEFIVSRFKVCPKTILAFNNYLMEHSKPYIIRGEKRKRLNEELYSNNGQKRSLNRLGIKFLTDEQYQNITQRMLQLEKRRWNPFNPITHTFTISSTNIRNKIFLPTRKISDIKESLQIGGKNIKRKNKRKNKRKTIKRKNKRKTIKRTIKRK